MLATTRRANGPVTHPSNLFGFWGLSMQRLFSTGFFQAGFFPIGGFPFGVASSVLALRSTLNCKTLNWAGLILLTIGLFPYEGIAIPQAEHPSQVTVTTQTFVPDEDFILALGRYNYTVAWQGIPVAKAWIDVNRENGKVLVDAGAKTNPVVDLLYELRYEAKGLLNGSTLSPDYMTILQSENSKKKYTRITFDPKNIHSEVARLDKESRYTLDFVRNNFTLGPMSGALLARSLKWKVGQSRDFDIFNGKSRYLITFTCDRLEKMKVLGEQREVFVFKPKVFNLSKDGIADKLRQAEIYITADNNRDIVKIKSEVFVGSVSAKLKGFVPYADKTLLASKSKAPSQTR